MTLGLKDSFVGLFVSINCIFVGLIWGIIGCICCEPFAIEDNGERKYDGQGMDAEINSTKSLCARKKLSDYEKF